MNVHKFGGTSVGDAACFANVADIIREHYHRSGAETGMVVVVSAMSGVTNQLIAGCSRGQRQPLSRGQSQSIEPTLDRCRKLVNQKPSAARSGRMGRGPTP